MIIILHILYMEINFIQKTLYWVLPNHVELKK